MKLLLSLSLTAVIMIGAGCAQNQNKFTFTPNSSASATTNTPPAIVTPENSFTAKVVSNNAVGRFVVLHYSSGSMPQMDQTLFLYRAGLKVAEIKITGPQRDDNTVADIVNGEAQVGDEVRDQ